MKKRIVLKLSESSIRNAISEIEKIQSERLDAACRKYAEAIRDRAQQYYNEAWVDDVGTNRRQAEVEGTAERTQNGWKVVAKGTDAVWVEFGAGVFYNGSAGSSPHPKGQELGLTIGSYGQGKGKQPAWGFYNESGELIVTRGTEAQMPLYRAFQEIMQEGIK